MFAFIIAVHVIVSVFLIFVILLQPAKSDGMAGLSGGGGGGGSQTVFGGRGSATFLSKVTTGCAIIFMLTSLTLAWRSSHSDSVLRARRNLAAQDTTKKPDSSSGPLSTPLPTGQTAPAPVTGGAAIPAQGSGSPAGNQTPATPAPAATKGPAAASTPPKPSTPPKK
jgi:preprotein translocase subunit SecG